MECVRAVTSDLLWLGVSDRQLERFEQLFPIPEGVSYNAYLVLDEQTVLVDTIDSSAGERFFENLEAGLAGRKLDYVIVNHMEPDHSGTLAETLRRYPEAKVVATAKAISMMGQFFTLDLTGRTMAVKEGDTLSVGRHCFRFFMAPMVHWPEVMVTYEETEQVLFSADAFGTFGALNGNLFADEVDFPAVWLPRARRYYANIVGKYGVQVQSLLKKLGGLELKLICPLHGPLWRENLPYLLEKYQLWSSWQPEEKGIVLFCGSIYGRTENAVDVLARDLAERGVKNIAFYDVSRTEVSQLVSEAFRYSHLVFASSTYNGAIYPPMENLLRDLKALKLQNRTVSLLENGTWAPASAGQMSAILGEMQEIHLLREPIRLRSSLQEPQKQDLAALADELAADILG